MKTILFSLLLIPAFAFSQNYGNLILDANRRFTYEKVFDAPGLTKENIQPMIVSKISSINGVHNIVGTDAVVTAEYVNTYLVFNTVKTKIGEFADAITHFYGKVNVSIKDNKYRVQVTNMKSVIDGKVFSLEQLTLIGKKKVAKVLLEKLDTYFTNFYALNASDTW